MGPPNEVRPRRRKIRNTDQGLLEQSARVLVTVGVSGGAQKRWKSAIFAAVIEFIRGSSSHSSIALLSTLQLKDRP